MADLVVISHLGLPCDPPIVDGITFAPHPDDANLYIAEVTEEQALDLTRIPAFTRYGGAPVVPAVPPAAPNQDAPAAPPAPAGQGDAAQAPTGTGAGQDASQDNSGDVPPAGDGSAPTRPISQWGNDELKAFLTRKEVTFDADIKRGELVKLAAAVATEKGLE